MGKIKLNLRARGSDFTIKSFQWRVYFFENSWIGTKKQFSMMKNHIGIKTARALIRQFKDSGLCPTIERVSFSQIVVNY